ncbi:hypothetical protein JW921_04240 [Candidatus Fermentibacterales bacterium]|nr:hypothetical protein [Candidatus Fermentibacterales bacterium]
MKIAFLSLVLAFGLCFAQDPEIITIEYDIYSGYGDAPLTAIANLWPACTVEGYNGNPAGWVNDIDENTDIAIGDMHNYGLTDVSAYQKLTDWYNNPALGPMFYACWMMQYSYDDALTAAMGISAVSAIGMPPAPHYLWEVAHPIADGITDWSYADPGYGTGGNRLTVSDAVPVTGWTASSSPGQAALCVANDGESIISGYFASLNPTQAVDLWENILTFMWGEEGLTPSTWGNIKAEFGI